MAGGVSTLSRSTVNERPRTVRGGARPMFFKLLCTALLVTAWCGVHAGPARVVLDTGHTPLRSGATSAQGRSEFGFNARLAQAVADALAKRGFTVDRVQGELALGARTRGTAGAALFVSIHHDSIQQAWIDAGWRDRYAGFSVFVSNKNPMVERSVVCARHVGRALSAAGERPSLYHATPIAGENRPLIDPPHGVHRYDDLIVLKTAKSPAVLVEAGVIANAREEERLGRPEVVARLAQAIASGVAACVPVGR